MNEFFVVCPYCDKKPDDCKYLARNITSVTTGEIVNIRRGRETYICPICSSEDCIDHETYVCCVCDMIVHPKVIITCRECNHTCSALPSLKRAPKNENNDEDPGWCEMDAFCTDYTFVVDLSCNHKVCLECFVEYASSCCNDMSNVSYDERTKQFHMICFADCKISHPIDLLRLGGDRGWKRLGGKMLEYRTNLDKNRCICPLSNCGTIIDGVLPMSESLIIKCPTCKRSFCRHCNEESIDNACPHKDDLEKDQTYRRCPMCHIPVTHYYGDECHHIGYGIGGCPGCRLQGRVYHWCFYCLNGGSEYPVYCKQNHWFCLKDCPVCPDCPQCQKYAKPGKREKHNDKYHTF